jgi:predicted dehydrogenase
MDSGRAQPGYRVTPDDDRIRLGVGMFGHGFMGRAHTNAFRTFPYIFWPSPVRPDLVAVAGRNHDRVLDSARRYGFERYTTDWRDVIADERITIFDNAGPDEFHVEPTLAAIAANKHVICEKPLALASQDAIRLANAAQERDIVHLTCFNYRFMPAVRLAYELIADGQLGDLHQARFRYSQEWRADPTAELPLPAGALDLIGCHAIDQARYLVGDIGRVAAIAASPVTTPARRWMGQPVDQMDSIVMAVEFDGGATGTIDASLVAPGCKNMLAWEINGSRGSVQWSLEELNVLYLYRERGSRVAGVSKAIVCEPHHTLAAPWWPTGHLLGWEHGHVNMIAHFLASVAEGRQVAPHGASFVDGAQAAVVADAAREACDANEWVTVPRLDDWSRPHTAGAVPLSTS